jgi:hypothetical protein
MCFIEVPYGYATTHKEIHISLCVPGKTHMKIEYTQGTRVLTSPSLL